MNNWYKLAQAIPQITIKKIYDVLIEYLDVYKAVSEAQQNGKTFSEVAEPLVTVSVFLSHKLANKTTEEAALNLVNKTYEATLKSLLAHRWGAAGNIMHLMYDADIRKPEQGIKSVDNVVNGSVSAELGMFQEATPEEIAREIGI